MYCSREYFKTSRLIQQYEKSTPEDDNDVNLPVSDQPLPSQGNQSGHSSVELPDLEIVQKMTMNKRC